MKRSFSRVLVAALVAATFALAPLAAGAQTARRSQDRSTGQAARSAGALEVPVTYYKLPNGLRVVLSQDKTAPTVVTAVYYNIGFRLEPRDRTGFAHLFEHLMFQGSQNLGKMEFIRLVQENGGILNGSTRFDYTNYFEVLPSHKLETALWAEADRMRGLKITEENLKNQQGVVSNEVKVNVLNTPYGGFPWLDMPQHANTNWYNAHNFYGELSHLEAATLEDAQKFFDTYYAPNNAVLVVAGDFETADARRMIDKYFSSIPAAKLPPVPDLSEPRQEKEKFATKKDPLARRPALAFAYHMPPRNTPEYYAMGLLDQILAQGEDSLLHQELVKQRGYTGGVLAGINIGLGNMFNYYGPMLWTVSLFHDNNVRSEQIMTAADSVIERVQTQPLDAATIERAHTKLFSSLYDYMTSLGGFGRADLLASFALFDDDPNRINRLDAEFRKVTPELLQKTAREYLRRTNRTVLTIEPGAAQAPARPAAGR
jgi:predicted Zn-dependent peptidase